MLTYSFHQHHDLLVNSTLSLFHASFFTYTSVMLYITIPHPQQIDYFTFRPPTFDHDHDHFSTETPLVSPDAAFAETAAIPTHPLLARRDPLRPASANTDTTPAPTLLQMQTSASHQPKHRPDPSPVQNVLHTTSDDSSRSGDSSRSSPIRVSSSIELARCSRCQRTPSIDAKTGKNNMVEYGLNLWYCRRCAQMVGLGNR